MRDSVIMWVYVSGYMHPKATHTYTLKKRGKCQKSAQKSAGNVKTRSLQRFGTI